MNYLEQLRARLAFTTTAQPAPSWRAETTEEATQLYLYGVIGAAWGDVTAAALVPAIRAADPSRELHLFVNSPGGDVYEGVAIRNAIKGHAGRVVITVDGLAASAASFILTAGDEVVMGAGAEVMIHDAWMIAMGNADELREMADDLDRISDTIAAMYAEKAGGDFTDWRAVMKSEMWYSAEEAVEVGLADRLAAEPAAASAHFDLSMYAHAGRASAPAPRPVAVLAHPRKESIVDRKQLAAALAAGTITQEQHDAALATLNLIDTAAPAAPSAPAAPVAVIPTPAGQAVPAEYAAGPQDAAGPRATVIDRPKSFEQVHNAILEGVQAQDLGAALRTINNELSLTVAADDAGQANFGRPEWLGEIWQAQTAGRPYIDSLGGAKELTTMKVEGYRWARSDEYTGADGDVEGRVAEYAGEGAEVPTGKRKTKKIEADAIRWGFGSKHDRILTDLGSRDLTADLFGLLGADFDKDSDAKVRAHIVAAATNGGEKASIISALVALVLDLKAIGATATKVWVSREIFEEFSELKVNDLPAWLAKELGFNLTSGNAEIASGLDFDIDFGLTGRTLLGYDRRAFTARQSKRIQLEAFNISDGTVEIGFFAYGGQITNDARAARRYTIAVPAVEEPSA